MKIGLGTVQFGLDYGVSNRTGKTPFPEVKAILAEAAAAGISVLDTAPAYGDSESVLGACMPAGSSFRIVTKTPAPDAPFAASDAAGIRPALEQSLRRLGRPGAYGLLVHRVEDLLGPFGDALWKQMRACETDGLVQRIGASIYTAAQADALLDRYPIRLVQLPLNVLDQRMLRSGHLVKLKRAGCEIHVRSAFLQGLLLMAPSEVHPYFAPIRPLLESYAAFLARRSLTPLRAALGFATGIAEVDAVVCGVNDSAQFRGIVGSAAPLDTAWFREFALEDEAFINPSHWKLGR